MSRYERDQNGEGAERPNPFGGDTSSLGMLNGELKDMLDLEKAMHPELSGPQLAQTIYESAAPMAAVQIATIAQRGGTERSRLDAAKYITDRALGRITEMQRKNGDKDPLVEILEGLYGEAAVDKMKGVQ